MSTFTRRQMLAMTTLAIGAPGLSAHQPAGHSTSSQNEPEATLDTRQWIHHNRTLIAEAYNPPFYPSFDYMPEKAVGIALDLNCDSMRFPTASYYANFPTRSGYPIHPDLKGDPMRETLAQLRKASLRTIAYIPLNHPFMQVESKDPRYAGWTRRFADGSPMTTSHYGWGRFYEGCINSPIREMAGALVSEVLDYDFDVLYFDGPYQGMDHRSDFCYCEHCQRAHQVRFGKPVP